MVFHVIFLLSPEDQFSSESGLTILNDTNVYKKGQRIASQ